MATMNPMKRSFCIRAELNHLHAPSLPCGGEESLLKHFSHRMDSSHLSFHPTPPDNFISSYAKWKVFRCSSALYSRETTPSPPLHEEFIFKQGSADMLLLFSFFFLLNSNLKAPICQKKKKCLYINLPEHVSSCSILLLLCKLRNESRKQTRDCTRSRDPNPKI